MLALLLEHFLSKVNFQLLHAGTFCRDLGERVIESFPTKTKKKRNPGTPLSCKKLYRMVRKVSLLLRIIFSQTILSSLCSAIESLKIFSCSPQKPEMV